MKLSMMTSKDKVVNLPDYAIEGAACIDIEAAIGGDITLEPGGRAKIPTGIHMAVPDDMEFQIRPRSGLADKHGITVLNSPGIVDSGFRGEIKVLLINHGDEPFTVENGMRIAQGSLNFIVRIIPMEVPQLDETKRGDRGFGSTGV